MECRTPPCLPRGGLWPSSPQNVRSQGQYSTQERSPSLCEECVGPSSTRPGVHDSSSMTLIKGHRSRIRASTLPTALQPDSVGSGGESPFPGSPGSRSPLRRPLSVGAAQLQRGPLQSSSSRPAILSVVSQGAVASLTLGDSAERVTASGLAQTDVL